MSALSDYLNNRLYEYVDFVDMTEEEKRMVWQWRNNIKIRQWMYNKEIIEWKDHLKFIESLKIDRTKKYWLVKCNKSYFGSTYIVNLKDGVAELGYYIAPDLGKMIGIEFVYFTLNFLFNNFGMKKVYAYSLIKNRGINSLNSLFGFSKEPVSKIVNNEVGDYFYRELSCDTWNNNIRHDKTIEKLLSLYIK